MSTLAGNGGKVPRTEPPLCLDRSRTWAVKHSALAYQRMAPTGKAVAAANGNHVSRGTAARRGDLYSALAGAFRPLAESEYTTAWSAITEAKVLVKRGELRKRSEAELQQRLMEIGYEVTKLTSELMRLVYEDGVSAERRAVHAELADVNEEAAGICDQLDERKEGR